MTESVMAAATGLQPKGGREGQSDVSRSQAAEPHQSHDGAAARSESLASGSAAGLPYKRREVIGDATLYLGDCREILPTLGKVDAVVTDPPYGIGFAAQPTRYQRANGMQSAGWDDAAPQALVDAWRERAAVSIIWGGQYFDLPPSRGWLIWSKIGNAPSMADVEMAWTSIDMNARSFEKSVKSASLEKNLQTAAHPSQKPVALMEWCLDFVPAAALVVDPFVGTGTTGVACSRLGRAFIGIEIEPKYFDIACRRIDEAYKQPRLFAEPAPKPKQDSLFDEAAA